MMRAPVWTLASVLSVLGCLAPAPVDAADLKPRTAQAYDKYAEQATRDFVTRAQKAAAIRRCDGVITARAGSGDGILDVPDGLIHHWQGLAFVKGVTVQQVEAVARDYSNYPKVYKAALSSKVISQEGGRYRVLIRIKEGEMGISAVLDIRSEVEYRTNNDGSVTATSRSEEIRQIENAGERNERPKPVGRDSGYLWRAHTFTHFIPEKGGVFMVMETLGLSRRFPLDLVIGWAIEPAARRLGRKSVEGSLNEFLTAIRRSAGLPAAQPGCN